MLYLSSKMEFRTAFELNIWKRITLICIFGTISFLFAIITLFFFLLRIVKTKADVEWFGREDNMKNVLNSSFNYYFRTTGGDKSNALLYSLDRNKLE